jgi:hypothetical protein
MAPNLLIALQSVSVAPGTSMVVNVKLFCALERTVDTLSSKARETQTNNLVLVTTEKPPESVGENRMQG